MKARLFATISAVPLLMLGGVAVAQTAPDTQEPEVAKLDEIVVTAQRRSENLQRAALAVDVVTAEELLESGVTSAQSLNQIVPSLTVQSGGGSTASYFVRGVGNFTQNAYSDPAISFNLDGVYIGRPTSTSGTFFDLERIEVLKGPQGTLYGRNATAGAINVIPNKPVIGVQSGNVSIGWGNYQSLDAQGAFNAPIGDNSAFRVSGSIAQRDGYNDDGTWDEDSKAVRAQFLTRPTDDLSLRISADYAEQGGTGATPVIDGFHSFRPGTPASDQAQANYVYTPTGISPSSGLFTAESLAIFSRAVIGGAFINPAPPARPNQDNVFYGVTGELNLTTPLGTFTLVPAYRKAELDSVFNGPVFQAAIVDETDEQFSTELRFTGERIGMFDYILGAYYFDEQIEGTAAYNQYLITAYQEYESKTKSYAFFGRATAHLSDRLRLVGGIRYTQDEKTFDGIARNLIQICTNAPPPAGGGCFGGPSQPLAATYAELARIIPVPTAPGPANSVAFGTRGNRLFFVPTTIKASPTFEKVTYRVAGEWDVAERSLLYASFETGFRSGGFSLASGRETFQPETIEAFTLGSKNRFFDNRLQLNLEAFYWSYDNQQISHFGADGNGNNGFFTENIGASTIRGLEIEGQYQVADRTRVTGTVQYIDSVFDEFSYRAINSGIPPVTGCAIAAVQDRNINATPGNDAEYVIDCSGKTGYNSPELSLNFGIEHGFTLSGFDVTLQADTRYRSERVAGFDYTPQQYVEADWISNAVAIIGPEDAAWSITAYVRNIEDLRFKSFAQYNSSGGGVIATNYSAPRTLGVLLNVAF